MKKPSGKQSTNDFPRTDFDSPLESVPVALPSPSLTKQEQPEGEQVVKKTPPKAPPH